MSEVELAFKKKFNWWIPAFFIALFAFEVVRELYVYELIPKKPIVISSASKPNIYYYDSGNGFAFTTGEWSQPDDAGDFEKLFSTFSSIECDKSTEQCTEQNVLVNATYGGYVALSLDSSSFKIDSFTKNEVVYSEASECYMYKVSINAATKSTTAIKERTPLNTLPQCADVPARRVYTLNYEDTKVQPKTLENTEAFLPIFRTIAFVIDLFD